MIIKLKGTVFCVAGGFRTQSSRAVVERLLHEGGATLTQSIADKTQVLIHGYGASGKVSTANTRGIPVLDEASLEVLLAEGEVEVVFEAPSVELGEDGVMVLLGEVRSALAHTPSMETWGQLIATIDRCALEQVQVLVDYIQPHLLRWTPHQQMFCIAPKHWIVSMTKGVTSPCYRLIRWLDLTTQNISATLVRKIIGCEDLIWVRRLDLSNHKRASTSLLKDLSTQPRWKSLSVLSFGRLGNDVASGLDAGDALNNVRTLVFRHSYQVQHRRCYLDILCANSFQHVSRVQVFGAYGYRMLNHFDDDGIFPELTHLELSNLPGAHGLSDPLGLSPNEPARIARANPQTVKTLETLTIASPLSRPYDFWSSTKYVMDLSEYSNLKTLRLYTTPDAFDEPDALSDMEHLFHLDRMILPPSLRTLVTNLPLDAARMIAFMVLNPSVEVVEDPLGLDF